MSHITNTISYLRSTYSTLRPAERKVADVILKDPEQVVHLSITELAWQAKVSDATVVKFCKRLGCKGFQEFRILLAQDVVTKREPIYGAVKPDDDVETIREKIFSANIAALQDTRRVLDKKSLEAAVQALGEAGEIHFYGMGASGIVALDAEQKFARVGLRAHAFVDSHLQMTRAALLKPGDVAVGISYSGETQEIVESLQMARSVGATTIAITQNSGSSVARVAHQVLLIASQENILRSGAISSRIAQLSTIDTLFIAVALVDYGKSLHAIERTKEALSQWKDVSSKA